jgi:hypothetical protein
MSRFEVISVSFPQREQRRKDVPLRTVRTHLWPNGQVQKQRQCERRSSFTRGVYGQK